jgi:protein Mpv17
MRTLVARLGGGLPPRRPRATRRRTSTAASSSSSPSTSPLSNPLLNAALTSGGLSLAGDVVAQLLAAHYAPAPAPAKRGWFGKSAPPPPPPPAFDAVRAARMFGFGFLFYGPYQHWWYRALDGVLPGRSTGAFLGKVAANQLLLAPVVLAAVFSWTLGLTGRARDVPAKIKADLVPTMVNGWKFWVPVAAANFYAVPLESRVLFMSAAGVVWTAYLSHSSAAPVGSGGALGKA